LITSEDNQGFIKSSVTGFWLSTRKAGLDTAVIFYFLFIKWRPSLGYLKVISAVKRFHWSSRLTTQLQWVCQYFCITYILFSSLSQIKCHLTYFFFLNKLNSSLFSLIAAPTVIVIERERERECECELLLSPLCQIQGMWSFSFFSFLPPHLFA